MERITNRNNVFCLNKKYVFPNGAIDTENVVRKLAEYEDLEEDGRLAKLPCRVGDSKYCFSETQNKIISGIVHCIFIQNCFFIELQYYVDERPYALYDLFLPEELFDTYEEAQNSLTEKK